MFYFISFNISQRNTNLSRLKYIEVKNVYRQFSCVHFQWTISEHIRSKLQIGKHFQNHYDDVKSLR